MKNIQVTSQIELKLSLRVCAAFLQNHAKNFNQELYLFMLIFWSLLICAG